MKKQYIYIYMYIYICNYIFSVSISNVYLYRNLYTYTMEQCMYCSGLCCSVHDVSFPSSRFSLYNGVEQCLGKGGWCMRHQAQLPASCSLPGDLNFTTRRLQSGLPKTQARGWIGPGLGFDPHLFEWDPTRPQ